MADAILLTNDDGIDAPGLAALETVVRRWTSAHIVVVAPVEALSGCSHRVTTDADLEIEERGPDRFAVHGTPADCVRLALAENLVDPDWVLAGINEGGNLGVDAYYSGTVAAAREACILGKPAIALSQYRARGLTIDWTHTARLAKQALDAVAERAREPGSFWNINLPHPGEPADSPPVRFCVHDVSPMEMSYRRHDGGHLRFAADYHLRPRRTGGDIEACFSGGIAITRLKLE